MKGLITTITILLIIKNIKALSMKSSDQFFEINDTLSKIRGEENKLKNSEKTNIQLTRKESIILLFFICILSLAAFLFSNHLFYWFDIEHSSSLTLKVTHGLVLGNILYCFSIVSLCSYFIFCEKECSDGVFDFTKKVSNSTLNFTIFSFFFGTLFGLIYTVFLGVVFKLSSVFFSLQIFNCIVFFVLFSCFTLYYIRHFRKDLFKNEKDQQATIKEFENNKNEKLKKLEDEAVSIRKKIINSIDNIDKLVYFSFLIENAKLTELRPIKDTIEKNILKHEKYESLLEYEQETLLNKIEKNKISIKNE